MTENLTRSIMVVGEFGDTHLGSSFSRAIEALGHRCIKVDATQAYRGSRVLASIMWRCLRWPIKLHSFNRIVNSLVSKERPDVVIVTGRGPITSSTLESIRKSGAVCINFSSDDPFNPVLSAPWHLTALPLYDLVYSPRESNIEELRSIGCKDVRHMRFAFDQYLLGGASVAGVDLKTIALKSSPLRVLFVGGADKDRRKFFSEFGMFGPDFRLVGSQWDKYKEFRDQQLGRKNFAEVLSLSKAALINICLVRRANRDGHVMRTYELGAIGACVIAEDTHEHREIYGVDGQAVRYFTNAKEAAMLANELLFDAETRNRLSCNLRLRMEVFENTYDYRVKIMLENALEYML